LASDKQRTLGKAPAVGNKPAQKRDPSLDFTLTQPCLLFLWVPQSPTYSDAYTLG